MASFARVALRQTCLQAPSKRLFSSQASTLFKATTKPSSPIFSAARRPSQSLLAREALKVASFHSTAKKQILPVPPQEIDGTVNDAAKVPPTSPVHGSYHWSFERLICVGLVPLTVAPFAAGHISPVIDAVLCSALLLHSHIGFDAMVTDYFPKKHYNGLRLAATWLLRTFTVLVGISLYEFETNDVGLTEAIKRVWKA